MLVQRQGGLQSSSSN